MKLRPIHLGILVLAVLFGGIYASDVLGIWRTESSKVPVKIQEGEFAGASDPADIRGSYTFGDIAQSYPISVDVLAEAFQVDEDPEAFQLKLLEEMYPSEGEVEMGTSSVRFFVARYTGLPYEATGEEALFPRAVDMLKEEDKITEEEAREIPLFSDEFSPETVELEEAPEEEPVEPLVNGNTTVADLFASGLKEEEIIAVIGTFESKGEKVRDVCQKNGIQFSTVKTVLIEMMEANQ